MNTIQNIAFAIDLLEKTSSHVELLNEKVKEYGDFESEKSNLVCRIEELKKLYNDCNNELVIIKRELNLKRIVDGIAFNNKCFNCKIFDVDEGVNTLSMDDFIICGIYFLLKGNEVVYVGKSKNIRSRCYEHIKRREWDNDFYFDGICFKQVEYDKLTITEEYYIRKFWPIYNNDSVSKLNRKIVLSKELL